MVDLHCHLIPGVDDGATSLEEALDALGELQAVGVTGVVCTPHLDASMISRGGQELAAYEDEVVRSFRQLTESSASRFPELHIARGYEVAVDIPDPEVSSERFRLDGGTFLLMEWPGLRVPPGTARVIQRIRSQGVWPVIAHPERYRGVDQPLAVMEEWKETGAFLQVNHGSLLGRYGPNARQTAFLLLQEGWVDYLSSDFHGRARTATYVGEAQEVFQDMGAEVQWDLLTRANPRRLLGGDVPLPVPPLPQEGWLGRLRRLLSGQERD
ncbi:MAG: CpsB/CapC family capsule biosynthesis tyrosine phosphatase [Gemmatimonadota bacterium]